MVDFTEYLFGSTHLVGVLKDNHFQPKRKKKYDHSLVLSLAKFMI